MSTPTTPVRDGGSYILRDGKPEQVTPPTADHPEGNRPRPATPARRQAPAPQAARGRKE